MGLLDRVFRRRVGDASKIDGPTRVALECTVASANTAISPVTGGRAAFIRGTLLEQRSAHGGRGGGVITRFKVLGRALFGPDRLILDAGGATIHVPTSVVRLGLIEDTEGGEMLGAIPDALVPMIQRSRAQGPLAYREAFLLQDDLVVLEATLERVAESRGGYREAPSTGGDLKVVEDDRVIIRER